MSSKPIPLHSRVSAHLFEEEDVIEFEDVFDVRQDEEDVSVGSIERLLYTDLHSTSVCDVALPRDDLVEVVDGNQNAFENMPIKVPVLQPRGTNGKPLVYSDMKADDLPFYTFNFELTQISEQGGLERAFCVSAFVKYVSTTVGQLNALLVDREADSEIPFFATCSQSDYVKNVVSSVCDANGTVRYGSVDMLAAGYHRTASRSGLLVLNSIIVDQFHRHDDVGIRCVWALLQWLNTDAAAFTSTLRVSSMWSLALVAPLGQQGIQCTWDVRDRLVAGNRVVQQFRRIGFQQTQRGSSVMYAIPARLQQLPRQSRETFPSQSLPDFPSQFLWN